MSGSCNGRLDTTDYGGCVDGLTPETLIANVSEVLDIAQFAVRNITGTGSANANSDRFLNISMDAHRLICSPDSDVVDERETTRFAKVHLVFVTSRRGIPTPTPPSPQPTPLRA